MADEATEIAADPAPTEGITAVSTDAPAKPWDGKPQGDEFVDSAEDRARNSGDPYFNEYAEDPNDKRASKGEREPRPIDHPSAVLLGVAE